MAAKFRRGDNVYLNDKSGHRNQILTGVIDDIRANAYERRNYYRVVGFDQRRLGYYASYQLDKIATNQELDDLL